MEDFSELYDFEQENTINVVFSNQHTLTYPSSKISKLSKYISTIIDNDPQVSDIELNEQSIGTDNFSILKAYCDYQMAFEEETNPPNPPLPQPYKPEDHFTKEELDMFRPLLVIRTDDEQVRENKMNRIVDLILRANYLEMDKMIRKLAAICAMNNQFVKFYTK